MKLSTHPVVRLPRVKLEVSFEVQFCRMGYGGAVWQQSYNDGQDYRNEPYNQRGAEPFNQRAEPFNARQDYRDGGFRPDQSQASGFDNYGGSRSLPEWKH